MNDAAQLELTKWITGLRETAEKVNGFVLEQAPEVAKEIIMVGRAWHTSVFVACLTALIVLAVWTRRHWDDFGRGFGAVPNAWTLGALLSFFGMPTLFAFVFIEFTHVITAWFAPRLYLIGELAELAGRAAGGGK